MQNRRLRKRTGWAALTLLGGLMIGLPGCGGDDDDLLDSLPLINLSFDNAQRVSGQVETAIQTGTSPPELAAIHQGVDALLTPAQQAYLDNLFGENASDAEIDNALETLADTLLTESGEEDINFNPPAAFANDLDRIEQGLRQLPFQAGLPTLVTQDTHLEPLSSSPEGESGILQTQGGRLDAQCYRRAQRTAQRLFQEARRHCMMESRACSLRARRLAPASRRRQEERRCRAVFVLCLRNAQVAYRANLITARSHCTRHDQGGGS